MPTIFSHAIFASAIGTAFQTRNKPTRFWVLTALCPIIPDADVIAFVFRVGYGSMFGHRGITHSVAFAIIVGVIAAGICSRSMKVPMWKLAAYFGAVTFSHPLLDMLTNGGLGVALLAPFGEQRFFFPWRPIEVSPIGVRFFSERGVSVIVSEFVWIWTPSLCIAAVAWVVRRKRHG